MSLIRGVLLAGKFRTQSELNRMSADDQRNTLIVVMSSLSNQSNYQSFSSADLAGVGAVMVFLREGKIRDDRGLKSMSADDQRNTLIVEINAQTKLSVSILQGMSNIELVRLGLGKSGPGSISQDSYIRGILLAGKFRTQHELNGMSHDDQRNTLIVVLTSLSNQTNYQSFNDFDLAGAGAVMVFLRECKIRNDAALKSMSADDQRNTLIVEIGIQTRLGSRLQSLTNMDLVLAGLGIDPAFSSPGSGLHPPDRPPGPIGDIATFDSGPVTSDLALGGSVHLVMRRNGDFTFSCHAHDSGFDNIDYVMSAALVTGSGIAFTFQHPGHVEGTSAGLPFGTPDRNDDFVESGQNAMITREFDGVFAGAKLIVNLEGKDKLVGGVAAAIDDLLSQAAEAIGKAAVAAAVALVV